MSLEIRNASVFYNGDFFKTDIIIKEGKIFGVEKSEEKETKFLDAKNLVIFPGLIDMHVHFRDFLESYKEDWESASIAAASGGITAVFDMPNNKIPILTKNDYDSKLKEVEKKSVVNFGLYIAATNENIDEINSSNIRHVKLYYGMTTGEIKVRDAEEIFRKLSKDKLIVAHAEENEIIEKNTGRFDKNLINYHSLVRDNSSEVVAVRKLLMLSKKYGKKLHLTHIGTKESLELIKEAKKENSLVTCDTCPHYLFLDDNYYDKLGNLAKVNPPLRSMTDRSALWEYINEGVIDCICSDHAPHTLNEKNSSYDLCPSGFPGVETTLRMMLTAVNEGKMKLELIPKLLSENPAKILGLKNKGEIKEGYDADLTIVDINKESVIIGKNLYTKVKWSPFEGMKTKGNAVYTIINGSVIYDWKNKEINKEIKGKSLCF